MIIVTISVILFLGMVYLVQATIFDIVNLETKETTGQTIYPSSEDIELLLVGDIMLSRKVGRLMGERGLDYPFREVEPYIKGSSFTIGNLETAITDRGNPLPNKAIWFRAVPETAQLLKNVGFDVVSLANNHVLDYDTEGFLDTMAYLEEANVKYVGAGLNINEALEPVILEAEGIKIGILAFSEMADIFWSHSYPRMFKAEEDLPGIAPLGPKYEDMLFNAVKELRSQVDILIVTLHWGIEYVNYPNTYQRELAHKLVDAGVDLIHGHHPHCIQSLEVYQDSLIAYSLGNFVFDQDWSQNTKEGFMLKVRVNKWGINEAKLKPVIIEDCQPRIATGNEANRILQRINEISNMFNVEIMVDGEKGIIQKR